MRSIEVAALELAGVNWTKAWNDPAKRDKTRALLVALWREVGGTIPALAAETGLSQSTIKLWRRTDERFRELTPTRNGRPPRVKGAPSHDESDERRKASGE
jgi:hypothetical protein